jgi:hypothetical protein
MLSTAGNWLEQGPKEALKRICQDQPIAGYNSSVGHVLALGAPGERIVP